MPGRIKFCHITTFYPPYSFGGDAMYLYRLVNALARRGHEVDVIHCADAYYSLASAPQSSQFPHEPGVNVHTLRSGFGVLSPLLTQQTGGTWLKTAAIQRVLDSKKFDVIHYHNISLFGPKVLLMRPSHSDFIKLYMTHEHWLVCPMHVLWKNNEKLCDTPECLRCTLIHRRPPQWWRYTNLLERCTAAVDTFLSPSRFTRQMHHDRGFNREIEHLPYFLQGVEDSSSESPHSRPYFLFVGRLEKIKGVQDLLPVFRDYPGADLLIAGSGTYEAELRRLAQGMANVQFLGSLPQDRLRQLYRHAIALLVPSICYETFGIIIIEAFTQRTPVIVHDLGGLREVVEESGGGFSYRTAGELRAAMERLQADGKLRRELGERGYTMYQQRWSEEAHIERYLQVLSATASRKFGRVPWESLDAAVVAELRSEAGR